MSLYKIQKRLVAPKNQFNKFGGYNYRSCEDIVNAVKPLLAEFKYSLIISDDVVDVGGRIYVKATAFIVDESNTPIHMATAYAREAETRKGMDESQITGTASSYARKYALNGLFAIDDSKDADTEEMRKQQSGKPVTKPISFAAAQKYIDVINDCILDPAASTTKAMECLQDLLEDPDAPAGQRKFSDIGKFVKERFLFPYQESTKKTVKQGEADWERFISIANGNIKERK